MASASKNASVEEILASIRQAISEDDAKRSNERVRHDGRMAANDRGPVANVSDIFPDKEPEIEEAAAETVAEPVPGDHDVIEQAIEQALNGVRAELESRRASATRPVTAQHHESAASATLAHRAIPRARLAAARTVMSPRRALLSPRTETQVSGSFEDLAKAMFAGNSRKLEEVVEE